MVSFNRQCKHIARWLFNICEPIISNKFDLYTATTGPNIAGGHFVEFFALENGWHPGDLIF